MNITILGTGAWATALGCCLSLNKHNVMMWGIDKNEINDINAGYNKKYYGDQKLFANLKAIDDLAKSVEKAEYILLAVPSAFILDVIDKVKVHINKSKPITFINVAKGLDSNSNDVWSKSIKKSLKSYNVKIASLIGPSFAIDVYNKKPTIVNVAAKKMETSRIVSSLFNSYFFKCVPINDENGAQVLAALKNLLAIAIGIAEENHNSINTITALLTAGINEMQKIANIMGAKYKTILQYCGIGDIFLTCTCDKSRNFSFGKQIFRDGIYKTLEKNKSTVEGYKVYPIVKQIIIKHKLESPIFSLICKVLDGNLDPSKFVDSCLELIMIQVEKETTQK
ncbi:MAG: NAD(P)H-dependent glycerol-3-phosphate dehydrogenase [Malacoplasma sp.]